MPLYLEPLTPESFAPFGTVIGNPSKYAPAARDGPRKGQNANQGTALKYSPIAPLIDSYDLSRSGQRSEPRFSLFVCSPRPIDAQGLVRQDVLERHPFTTQAFIPIGLSAENARQRAFIVIVAPNSVPTSKHAGIDGAPGPDLSQARAFLANGDQGVTYGVGTWHAPMMVVGDRPVDFVVVQFVNGVEKDDCMEWWMEQHAQASLMVDVRGWERGGRREVKL